MSILLAADHVVLCDSVLAPGWVEVEGATIVGVGSGPPPGTAEQVGSWLMPGFVDIHCHGGAGADFTGGGRSAASVAALHRSCGTTAMLASLVSAPVEVLAGQVADLATAIESGTLGPVHGIHLEGPFLAPDFRGAHDPSALVPPSTEAVSRLLHDGGGWVKMVTLAPELPGADEAIAQLVAAGVTVAVGHTAASYEVTAHAISMGASVLTHAGNAMPDVHHRAPGPLVAALEAAGCHLEVILDGVHLHDAWARRILLDAGERAVLVTDAMAAAGAGDGRYQLGPLDVDVEGGVARLAGDRGIAGSTLQMGHAVRRACRIGVAPVAAAYAAATAPATAMGWDDVRGRIEVGLSASLVALDAGFTTTAVMCDGAWVPRCP